MKLSNNKFGKLWLVLLLIVSLWSCETPINPDLEEADPILVVDAWINGKPGNQVIVLMKTQPYFDNTLPPIVSGAIVSVTDNTGAVFPFVEDVNKKGSYVWRPTANESFGTIGNSYKLTVQSEGEVYEALSKMGRVPPIDSIVFRKNEPTDFNPDFYQAQFYATDPAGKGDTYWIRAIKNGVLLNKPTDINIAFDAGFSGGSNNSDGITFLPPLRLGINPVDTDSADQALSPYVPGDSLYVEIHSITLAAFNYLQEVNIQTNRPGGFAELFARPIANVPTNIMNVNKNGKKAIGFFNVAAVSGLGKRFSE
jgi:hypothetical protein